MTSSPARIAWEYGAPWNGAGAASVRTTVFSLISCSFGRTGLRQRNAERLEDRIQHVLRVLAVQEADVERQAGPLGEPLEEATCDVRAKAPDTRLREVDVPDEQRRV